MEDTELIKFCKDKSEIFPKINNDVKMMTIKLKLSSLNSELYNNITKTFEGIDDETKVVIYYFKLNENKVVNIFTIENGRIVLGFSVDIIESIISDVTSVIKLFN